MIGFYRFVGMLMIFSNCYQIVLQDASHEYGFVCGFLCFVCAELRDLRDDL